MDAKIIFLLFLLMIPLELQAKRMAPKEVPPLVHHGIRYAVPHFGGYWRLNQRGGSLEAWDEKTNKKIGILKIYTTEYKENLETDIQDVFITSLQIEDDKLLVWNEKGKKYEVDLKSRSPLKAKIIADTASQKIDFSTQEWKPDIENAVVESLNLFWWRVIYPPLWKDNKFYLGGGFEIHVHKFSGKTKGPIWYQ